MVVSRELVANGCDHIVAVSGSGQMPTGDYDIGLLDVIQDVAKHEIFRCDIADQAAWHDVMRFIVFGSSEPEGLSDPSDVDAFELLSAIVVALRQVVQDGQRIDRSRLERVVRLRDSMTQGLEEAKLSMKSKPQLYKAEAQVWLRSFTERLEELNKLISTLRSSAETAAATAPRGPSAIGLVPGKGAAAKKEPEEKVGTDTLMDLMAKEIARQRRANGRSKPHDFGQALDGGKVPEPPARHANEDMKPEPASPTTTRICTECGGDIGVGHRCYTCTIRAERKSLDACIQTARADIERKAVLLADRKAKGEKEEADRLAKEEADRLAANEAAQKADENVRLAEEERVRQATIEAERAARAEEARFAQEEADRAASETAAVKALDDGLCLKNHILEAFEVSKGFPCDICNAEAEAGGVMYGCRARDGRGNRMCDYDVCYACMSKRIRRDLRAQGHKV